MQSIKSKSLASLLAGIVLVDPEKDTNIHGLKLDSRCVTVGDLFIAYPGDQVDGRDFIEQAVRSGAKAILAEEDSNYTWPSLAPEVVLYKVQDLRHKISQVAARFYDNPSRKMHLTGITGTNGKTSIAYLLSCALDQITKNSCVYFGTLGVGFPHKLEESTHTTLDAISLQHYLADFSEEGVTHGMLEVSSHALDQGRVENIEFETALFTNLTRDHLDYHKTMEAYGEAKKKLFKQFGLKSAVINWDDTFGFELYTSLPDAIFKMGYSLNNPDADIYADQIRLMDNGGMRANIQTPWGEGILETPLIGRFNLYNILAIVGVLGLSYPLEQVLDCIKALPHVPGRMECVSGKPYFIVDYAHTPDALENVLITSKELLHLKTGKLWCVLGCGGDRDKGKRPLMGKIAEQWADHVIITNDNPRTENPMSIAEDILEGIKDKKAVSIILDREKAIHYAFEQAKKNDIILVAGKGHECYQIIGKEKHFFSDVAVCKKMALV